MRHTIALAGSMPAAARDTEHGAATSVALLPLMHGAVLTGTLLGVSPAAMYLRFQGDVAPPAVVALLPTSSVRLPLAMMSASPLPVVGPDVAVAIGDGMLRIGPHVWRTLRWFDPRPSGYRPAQPPVLAQAARLLMRLGAAEVGLETDRAWAAAAAMAAGDTEPGRRLLGGGPGLTPAGDDVVAGALAACMLAGVGPSPSAVATLLAQARIATTALSAALLECAAAGQVIPPAAVFLQALTGATSVKTALGLLRAVGSTSGTALAVGIVAALGAYQPDLLDQYACSAGVRERFLP